MNFQKNWILFIEFFAIETNTVYKRPVVSSRNKERSKTGLIRYQIIRGKFRGRSERIRPGAINILTSDFPPLAW